ncbi:MAG: SDR family NAD(P)-dependent oxidoreductase, partial [Desulfobacteraceae bacterium]|nr:SDR family NAD(P)-dependent oxidoreductase [Desulfobacteraceae bacterium]
SDPGSKGDKIINCRGMAITGPQPQIETFDLEQLTRDINQYQLSRQQCYEAYQDMGMDYGPGHQGLETVYSGNHKVLARIVLPHSILASLNQFDLHPSLVDAALQAPIGFMAKDILEVHERDMARENAQVSGPFLPFALEKLEITGPCSTSMWAYIRYSGPDTDLDNDRNKRPSWKKNRKLDIDILDDDGLVCIRMKGYSARQYSINRFETHETSSNKSKATDTVLYHPIWKKKVLLQEDGASNYSHHIVMLGLLERFSCSDIKTGLASIAGQKKLNNILCTRLIPDSTDLDKPFEKTAARLFEMIKKHLPKKNAGNTLFQILLPCKEQGMLFRGLSSLLKTVSLEHPGIKGQVIEVNSDQPTNELVSIIKENSRFPEDVHIRYKDGVRHVAAFTQGAIIQKSSGVPDIPWKNNGVYLITGGTGGLGLIFAREIAHKVRNPKLVLIGRSDPACAEKNQKESIKALELSGASVTCHQADVGSKKDVLSLIQDIEQDFGPLSGILHTAGITRDNYIHKKTLSEFKSVLEPKVAGTINLDHATRHMALDFFILFSSVTSVLGNIGQADYSTANAFMDSFAFYRNRRVQAGQRHGKTLSFNWPMWKKGGMQVDNASKKLMEKTWGMTAMETRDGIQALYQGWVSGNDQVMVFSGIQEQITSKIVSQGKSKPDPVLDLYTDQTDTEPVLETDGEQLCNAVEQTLLEMIAALLKISRQDLDPDSGLSEFGFDSITFSEFSNQLNETYHLELLPTIFFEYPTVSKLAAYLSRAHDHAFASKISAIEKETIKHHDPGQKSDSLYSIESGNANPRTKDRLDKREKRPVSAAMEPVAIIGMAGNFPESPDLEMFWENLVQGKDCISEIPADRWDWRSFYGDPQKEANKTNIKWG